MSTVACPKTHHHDAAPLQVELRGHRRLSRVSTTNRRLLQGRLRLTRRLQKKACW